MIKHIVCFKLKDAAFENCQKAAEILLSMKGKVTQIKEMEVGIDVLHSERSYDVILQVVVENMDELNAYQKDAYHCSVVKPFMHAVRETSVAVDYEI